MVSLLDLTLNNTIETGRVFFRRRAKQLPVRDKRSGFQPEFFPLASSHDQSSIFRSNFYLVAQQDTKFNDARTQTKDAIDKHNYGEHLLCNRFNPQLDLCHKILQLK